MPTPTRACIIPGKCTHNMTTVLYYDNYGILNSIFKRDLAFQLHDFKIATLTYKAVHLKQPPFLAQHLKLKSMHLNTRNNDQLLLQHPSVGTNSYRRRAFSYTAPTVWNKLPYKIRNAPSVTLFRKKLKTLYFKTSSRPPMVSPCLVRKSSKI